METSDTPLDPPLDAKIKTEVTVVFQACLIHLHHGWGNGSFEDGAEMGHQSLYSSYGGMVGSALAWGERKKEM